MERKRKMSVAPRNRTIAVGFLKGLNRKKYYGLYADLENQYARGTNQYPDDITSAYNLLLNHKSTAAPKTRTAPVPAANAAVDATTDTKVPAITFLQRGTPVAGSDGETLP